MTLLSKWNKHILIAGPCALESRSQLKGSIQALKQFDVPIFRASLWKPRTKHEWDGIGIAGIPMLIEETLNEGLIPATEVIMAKHAESIVDVLEKVDPTAKMVLWIGARNQNHFELAEIGRVIAQGPEGIYLMFKNQMWEEEGH